MADDETFDCFLSYNGKDRPAVRLLAHDLRAAGVSVWLDKEQLRPGLTWQPRLESGIRACRSVAVLIGAAGIGPWQDEEQQDALRQAVRDKRPVIPVLLPDAPKAPELPLFLTNRTWVDLRPGAHAEQQEGLDRLVWGITGERPRRITGERPRRDQVGWPRLFSRAPSLRLLHLSDLHFGSEADPVLLFQSLERDIGDSDGDLGFSKLDYLVISGDLTRSAQSEEFERVQGFLDLLFDTFGLSPERCLIVPGNHDLSWDAEVYHWVPARKVDERHLPAGHWRREGSGYLVRDAARYGNRFENFARFYKVLMKSDYPLDPVEQGMSVLSAQDRIQ